MTPQKKKIFVLTVHCFSLYRRHIFQRLLVGQAGMDGRLIFGVHIPHSNVKRFNSIESIPQFDSIDSDQYVLVRNVWITRWLLWQSGLLREVLRRNVAIVVMEGNPRFLSTWVAALLLRLFTKKRVLFWTHGITKRPIGLRSYLTRLFWRLSHGLLLYGNRARRIMIDKFKMNPDELYVVYNSLDNDQQVKYRSKLNTSFLEARRKSLFGDKHGNPILLYIGRLNHGRQLELLIVAARKLQDANLPVNLLLIGDGDAADQLRSQSEDCGLKDSVLFFGESYDEEEIAELIACSDICVAPGHLGLTGMHSLTFGTPVITHNDFENQMPEYEAVIQGKTGAFFERGNIESLVEVISLWLTSNINRDDIRRNCYEVIDKYYNPDTQIEIFRAAFEASPASKCLLRDLDDI